MAILPLFGSLLAQFYLTVSKVDGSPLPGVSVRVLNTSNQDVTQTLLPGESSVTNAFGLVFRTMPKAGVLPSGVYYFQLSLPGYAPATFSDIGFTGVGKFAVTLYPAPTSYAFTPPPGVVSPLAEVPLSIVPTGGKPADRVEVRVSRTDGRSSTIVQTPDAEGATSFDLRNRIRLSGPPALVPAGQLSSIDAGFADRVDVDVYTITDAGTAAIGGTLSLTAINIRPTSPANDLSVYALKPAGQGMGRMLIGPPVAFRGYYIDVIALLPELASNGYLLTIRYLNGTGADLTLPVSISLTAAPTAQRVRVDTDAPAETRTIVTQAFDGANTAISEPLTIAFRD